MAGVSRYSGIFLMICTLNWIAYSDSFKADWHFDDLANVTNNQDIQIKDLTWDSLRTAMGSRVGGIRPFAYLTFALNYYISGLSVEPYHIANLFVHILNAFFVFLLIMAITKKAHPEFPDWKREILSVSVALFWSLSPVQSQSVIYIVQRMNLLAAFFMLTSLLFYIGWRDASQSLGAGLRIMGCAGAALFGFASKENSFILPLLILSYEIYFIRRFRWQENRKFFALGAAGIILVVFFVSFSGLLNRWLGSYAYRDFTMKERLLTQSRVVIRYLAQLALPLPSRLALHHEIQKSTSLFRPLTTLFCTLLILSAVALALYLAKRNRFVSFFILWYFFALAIESSILPLEMMFEHRAYLPSIGFFAIALSLLFSISPSRFQKKRMLYLGLILCLALGLSVYFTRERSRVWTDEISLWEDNLLKYPNSFRVQNNLGTAYAAAERQEEAERALLEAIRLNPGYSGARANLALLYLNQGLLDKALQTVEAIDKSEKSFPDVYFNLGIIYARKGEWPKAVEAYRKAFMSKKGFAEAYYNLALAYLHLKDDFMAMVCFKDFLNTWKGDPDSPYVREAHRQIERIGKPDLGSKSQ